jgi:pyridoxamine 5'-phosphate oxidase
LIFFTNYQSRKGKDIAANPKVGVNFYWASLERQVRVSGSAHKTSVAESDEYFAERPRESQIAAWASAQSEVLTGRDVLENKMEEYTKKFEGMDVPRPENWGGYRIIPNYFEFWQGRPFRLHDRLIYCVDADFEWFIKRLAP